MSYHAVRNNTDEVISFVLYYLFLHDNFQFTDLPYTTLNIDHRLLHKLINIL